MQSTKFKIDYNETSEQPELAFVFNTASDDISDKLLRRFYELATDPSKKVLATQTVFQNGTSSIVFSVENVENTAP